MKPSYFYLWYVYDSPFRPKDEWVHIESWHGAGFFCCWQISIFVDNLIVFIDCWALSNENFSPSNVHVTRSKLR